MAEEREEKWINSDGYVLVLIDGVLFYEHRLVWQRTHGVPIPPGFVVHHRDHNKENNSPANLELMARGDHVREHNRRRRESRTNPPSP